VNQLRAMTLGVLFLAAGVGAVVLGMILPLPYHIAELFVLAGLVSWLVAIALGVRHWRRASGKVVVLVGLVFLGVMATVYIWEDSGQRGQEPWFFTPPVSTEVEKT